MKRALVIGPAPCLFEDLRDMPRVAPCTVVAVNDAGLIYMGRVNHWVSIHGMDFETRMALRERLGGNTDLEMWGHFTPKEELPGVNRVGMMKERGSSSLLAVHVALELGYDRIVVCGVPLTGNDVLSSDDVRGIHPVERKRAHDYTVYRRGWEEYLPKLKDRVRSMSGWTRDLLGAPSPVWLAG